MMRMKLMTKLKLIVFVVLISNLQVSSLIGSDNLFKREIFALHPHIGYNFNFFNTSFSQFDPIIECVLFEKGSGSGLAAGLTVELPLMKNTHLGIGLTYSDRSGSLTAKDTAYVRDLITPPYDVITTLIDNTVEAKLKYIETQFDVRTVLIPSLFSGPLRGYAGLKIGIASTGTVTQYEKITSPAEAVFMIDSAYTKRRDIADGEIKDLNNLLFGACAGLENMLYIGNGNYFTQAVSIDYYFNDIAKGVDWKTWSVRLDLGLRFGFRKPKPAPAPPLPPVMAELPAPPEKDPPVKVEAPKPVLGVEIANPQFRLLTGNELLATLPLVNAVFFDKGSSTIPSKYHTGSADMPEFFLGDGIEAHTWVMPRVAAIINKNPDARIIVQGASSGTYEKGGTALGRKRAEAVRKVLIANGVDPKKITVKASFKPKVESNDAFELGNIENQRVDLFVENAPLQEYVALQKFAELSGKYVVKSSFRNVNLDSGDVTMTTTMPPTSHKITKSGEATTITMESKRIDPGLEVLNLGAKVNYFENGSNAGLSVSVKDIPREMIELELSRFLAYIRFDYNSSELSEDNRGLLKQMSDFLPAGSTVIISGSADALGTEERNTVLAKQRADNTVNFIKSVSGEKFKIEWTTENGKFQEETPEGRFLNRNIKVRVKK